jgi:hypothetical protein
MKQLRNIHPGPGFHFGLLTIFLLISYCNASKCNAQCLEHGDCYEVKYMDFFEIPAMDTMTFSDSDLNEMLSKSKDFDHEPSQTNFIIPLIVHQLKFYHPSCNREHDTSRYHKLIRLYFIIRQMDINVLNNKSVAEQLDFIRNDFYSQVENPETFIHMIFTFDDGPLYGERYQYHPDSKTDTVIPMDFGKIIVVNMKDSSAMAAFDNHGKLLWSNIIKGSRDENITDLDISADNIHKSSAAYRIYVNTNGYNLMLYLKPEGKFIGYFQHW